MNNQDKSKEELLAELQELKQELSLLRASYEKDIAKARQNEIKLQNSEAQKNAILNGITTNIHFVDKDFNIVWANKTAAQSVNKNPDEMIGCTCHHFWADPAKPCENCPSVKALQSKKSEHIIKYTPDGKVWDEKSEPVFDAEGNLIGLVEIVTDITDLKNAEETISKSEEKFRSLYANMIDGSALHTLVFNDGGVPEDYRIIDVNPAFENMLGISREAVVGKTSREAYGVEEPPYFEIYSRVALTGEPEVFETYFTPLGKHFSISVYCPAKGSFATIFENITNRKKAENDLSIILTKYKVLFEILPIGITISDASGNIVETNQIAETILGISREEHKKRKIDGQVWQIIKPDGSPMSASEFASVQALEKKQAVTNVEMGIVKGNNHVTWLNVSASPVPLDGYGVAIVYNDITEHKEAEKENERIQKLLEDSQKAGKIGGWEFNIDTLELKWTREMYNIHEVDLNFKPNVDQRVNFYTPESVPAVNNAIQRAIEYAEPFDLDSEIITAKGNRRSVKAIGKPDLENRRIYGLFQDITERKLADQALKTSEEKYRNLFEKAQVGMFRTRMDGSKILDVNEKLLQTLGYSYEEMVESPSTIRYNNLEQRKELIQLLQKNESVANFEVEMLKKDNSVITVLLSVTGYPEEGILEGSFIDITDRKHAEEALQNSEAELRELNATKDKFFSIIAHDLKSPFNSILGFSEMLKDEARDLDIDSIVEYAGIINSSVLHTFGLLENLLDWARMQQGRIPFEPQKILLNSIVNAEFEGLKNSADQKNIELNNYINQNLIITADENMISTVLRNLVSNAIKFTPNGGEVKVEASVEDDNVKISVSDTGIGIKPETIRKLFKIETSFTTRGTENEKGTGLGLLLCKEFVEKHGGKVWVESAVGKGSCFNFTLHNAG